MRPVRSALVLTVLTAVIALAGAGVPSVGSPGPQPSAAAPAAVARAVLDPGVAGDLPVSVSDYRLDPVVIPGLGTTSEMRGHVVRPADEVADPSHPLVVLLHGNHASCYDGVKGQTRFEWPCRGAARPVPSNLGYDYLQQVLASQGYVTVSVSANAVNAFTTDTPDGGAAARAALLEAHLDQWATWVSGGVEEADLDQVVLVGHSRGGDGVAAASRAIPLDADYRVAGQVLLSPTSFGRASSPYVPTVVLLGSCDGDVADLQGQAFVDASRDLFADDTSLRSSVMMVGGNHNFFNTEWTPGTASTLSADDAAGQGGVCARKAPTRLAPAAQRAATTAYVAGAVQLFTGGDPRLLRFFDGTATRPPSAGSAVVFSHALGAGRDLRRPGVDATPTAPDGATTSLCQGLGTGTPRSCGTPSANTAMDVHWPGRDQWPAPVAPAFRMSWTEPGARGGLAFATPLDLEDARALDLRLVLDGRFPAQRLRVRLTDADGARTTVTPTGGPEVRPLPRRPAMLARRWAKTLRLDPGTVSGVDLARITSVEVVAGTGPGRLWILDVAAVPVAAASVPAQRAALFDLGDVAIDIRDGSTGTVTVEVPWSLSDPVPAPARLRVCGFDDGTGVSLGCQVLDLGPGDLSGVVPFTVNADRSVVFKPDDELVVKAFALHDVSVGRFTALVTITHTVGCRTAAATTPGDRRC